MTQTHGRLEGNKELVHGAQEPEPPGPFLIRAQEHNAKDGWVPVFFFHPETRGVRCRTVWGNVFGYTLASTLMDLSVYSCLSVFVCVWGDESLVSVLNHITWYLVLSVILLSK